MQNAIILAAGKGTRMHSDIPKVMHPILGKPMLTYPMAALKKAGADRIVVVVGHKREMITDAFPDLETAVQDPQLGTGHAVMQARQLEHEEGNTLIVNGDCACLQPETLKKLLDANKDASLTLLSAVLEDGLHYGRIIRNENGDVDAIVEAKDCSEEQKKVREINAGVYCFNNRDLFDTLKELDNNNAQHEYYLTDLVRILNSHGKKVQALVMEDVDEAMGINTPEELKVAEEWISKHADQVKEGA